MRILLRTFLFLAAYSGTVVLSLSLGSRLWPEGVGNEAEIIFWPATGIALFFVLKFGPGYAPVILLSVLPAVIFASDPRVQAILGATGNLLEVLVGWWLLTRLGRFTGNFENVRVIVALSLTSVVGGVSSALYPIYQLATGEATGELWHGTVLRFAFANGCGTMIVCVFLFSLTSGQWRFRAHRREFLVWLVLSLLVISFAFNAVFRNEINYAFIVYPFVIFAAIRYGLAECSLAMVLVVGGIYASLIRFGSAMPEGEVLPIIQFIQAFTWVLALTGFFVAALVAERRNAQREIVEKQHRLLETELERERARLAALRYQINPHFLFNSINSVCAALPPRPSEARSMLAELSDFLRSILDHPAADFAPIEHEFDSIRRYIAIEERRYGKNLHCELHLAPELRQKEIPIFILQPLVENAIRHGFTSSKQVLKIRVNASERSDRKIILEVANNGRWREETDREGIGLANIEKRLEIFFGDDAGIEHIRETDSVRVQVILPVKTDANRQV